MPTLPCSRRPRPSSATRRSRAITSGTGNSRARTARGALNRACIPFTQLLVIADPAGAIAQHAKKGRFDLIVMGSRGHGAAKGLLLGSVASKVIAQSDIPVTVVR